MWEFNTDVVQRQNPIVLDIDNDCIPEIIMSGFNNYNNDWLASDEIIIFDTDKDK